ncbi:hypothetical protein M1N16_02535 [Nitrospinaceae bacterium]|nr:hypothetical protein [Nitrospinaceae bacterium]
MKNILIAFTLLTVLACTTATKPTTVRTSYSSAADIDLFLSTSDENIENQVLDRLKSHGVDSVQIKQFLRATLLVSNDNPVGMQSNLKLKMNKKTYSYALYVPEPTKPNMPMIVIMHGMGGSGANTIQKWIERLENKFVILCPTYPIGAWWSKNSENFVLQLIREIRAKYPIDSNRIFLSGLSNGAIGAYLMGMFYPDQFAGVVPIAGGITKRLMSFLVNLNNTPMYIIQGEFDPIFPIELTRRTYKILSDFKSPVIFREHKERGAAHGGHFLPESEVSALVEWLSKQKRNPSPKVVRITREENHMKRVFWARVSKGLKLAALQIPGPEMEPLNIHDGKIATLFAIDKGNNRFMVRGKNVLEFELYLSSDYIDFNKPVVVTFQDIQDKGDKLAPGEKFVAYNKKVEKNMRVLLRSFKGFHDENFFYDAKITISTQNLVRFAASR